LLEELGWGLELAHDAGSGEPLDPAQAYRYRVDGGAERVDGVAEGPLVFAGASLLSLARDELADARSLADARRLLRAALDQCLDGRSLRTREVMLAMRAYGGPLSGG
jgi:DNA repair protein RecO (recombination protein O)